MSELMLIFPSSYFNIKKPDEALGAEYAAALETGLFYISLFSYDKWVSDGRLVFDREPGGTDSALYRGWMMKPEVYSAFYGALAERGIKLITSPKEYELFHIFPNIYSTFGSDTARMLVYPDGRVDLDEVRRVFRRFMVKDYVKSVKGTDFPRFFDNTVTREEFELQMEKFYKYRGGLRTGGICMISVCYYSKPW